MKYTLLDMTQSILSSMSSDEVNSIGDTTESRQVAEIIRQKYFDIVSKSNLPESEQLIQLRPSIDPDKPVLMYVPDGVMTIDWVKYYNSNPVDTASTTTHGVNTDITEWTTTSVSSVTIGTGTKTFTVGTGLGAHVGDSVTVVNSSSNTMTGTVTSYSSTTLVLNITSFTGSGTYTSWTIFHNVDSSTLPPPGYQYVNILAPRDFIEWVGGFNTSETDVSTFTLSDDIGGYPGDFTFNYKTQQQPTYCCIINNYYVVFDSYDNTQDDTLQASKTMAWGLTSPTFTMEDSFIPYLKEEQFPLLLNEAKQLAFYELKQQPHPLADKEIKQGWSAIQRDKAVSKRPTYFDELPNFGRSNMSGYGAAPRYFKLMGFDR